MKPSYLIVRFSAIGDCVMAAYIASAIRSASPESTIVWAVETRCMPVLDREKMLDTTVDFARDRWRKTRWSPTVWREQLAKFSQLRKMRFDFGMDLQGHSKTAICLRIARPRNRIAAFATDYLSRRLNPIVSGDPDANHRVERMLDAARTFGDFQLPEKPMMPQPVPRKVIGLSTDKPLATIATGAGAKNKQYPKECWEAVAEGLLVKGYDVLLLGGQSDPRLEIGGTVDRVGQWDLQYSMSAVAHSAIHLAADTGTGHMAAAFGVPFVSVFGPTDPKLFGPYSDCGLVLRESEDPGDVMPNQVLEAVEKLVG